METQGLHGNALAALEETVPACPICGRDRSVSLFGWQDYRVAGGAASSLVFRCSACDFHFRRLTCSPDQFVTHFKVAPYSSAAGEARWLERRLGFYNCLLDLLDDHAAGKSILDIGCAFGHFLDCASKRGYRPYGAEVSEAMAGLARSRTQYPISCRPLGDLRLPETTFDVVAMVDSFYYFRDPLETLRLCRRIVKPGGELLMRVTNRNPLARLHHFGAHLLHRGVPEMPFWTTDDAVSCYSRRSLTSLMGLAGFRVRKLTCIERGKKINAFGLNLYYKVTKALALLTGERLSWTPGIVCVATPR